MRLSPHLHFDGRCREAFEQYAKCLGGMITAMMTYGESPAAGMVAPSFREKILHATLTWGDQILTGADVPAEPPVGGREARQYRRPQGFSVLVDTKSIEAAERVFAGLAEGGEVRMGLRETFWAARFGMVEDRFGVPWMIQCGKGG
jgi:PhnB protein